MSSSRKPDFENFLMILEEYKDFDWTSVKRYLNRQLAKCVNECKSQATNAKRIVRTAKRSHSKQQNFPTGVSDSDQDSDEWDTDFDDDDDLEDEINAGAVSAELNNNTIKCNSDMCDNLASAVSSKPVQNKYIPKPPDQPVTPASILNINSEKTTVPRNCGSRPPLKRPPSQPPPPPVVQASPPPTENTQEDYEIPINSSQSSASSTPTPCATPVSFASPLPFISTKPLLNSLSSAAIMNGLSSALPESYEIIQSGEENYEIVDAPPLETKVFEKPEVPPRIPVTSVCTSPPPPLPQKPKKFQEIPSMLHKTEGYRSFNRPKLPVRNEEDTLHEIVSPVSTILNSLLKRRNSGNSSSSPKSHHSPREDSGNNSAAVHSPPNASSSDGHSSRSSSPDKEGLVTVGSSSFICRSNSVDAARPFSPQQTPKTVFNALEDAATSIATRPLPPVPKSDKQEPLNTKKEIHEYPWFHAIERETAEQEIKNMNQNGAFLVRPSKRAGIENPYTLTVLQNGKIFHLNIRHRPDDTFALGKEKKKEKAFPSIAELIFYHKMEPIILTSRGESAGQTILQLFPTK